MIDAENFAMWLLDLAKWAEEHPDDEVSKCPDPTVLREIARRIIKSVRERGSANEDV